MYDAPSEPSDNDNVSILYAKSEADLVEYSSGTQPNQGSCFQALLPGCTAPATSKVVYV